MPDGDRAEYARRLLGARVSELSAAEVAALTKSRLVAEILDAIAVVLDELLSEIDDRLTAFEERLPPRLQ